MKNQNKIATVTVVSGEPCWDVADSFIDALNQLGIHIKSIDADSYDESAVVWALSVEKQNDEEVDTVLEAAKLELEGEEH